MSPTGAPPEQHPREGSQATVGQADHPLRQPRGPHGTGRSRRRLRPGGVGSGERRHTHLPADREAPNARSCASSCRWVDGGRPPPRVCATSVEVEAASAGPRCTHRGARRRRARPPVARRSRRTAGTADGGAELTASGAVRSAPPPRSPRRRGGGAGFLAARLASGGGRHCCERSRPGRRPPGPRGGRRTMTASGSNGAASGHVRLVETPTYYRQLWR